MDKLPFDANHLTDILENYSKNIAKPDTSIPVLCTVIASLVAEVERLRQVQTPKP